MLTFEEFPKDNAFWIVKCIDRFRLPHAASESASVDVRLQRLDSALAARAASLRPRELHSIFGSTNRPAEDFRTVAVHVGSLPALRVGQIFRRGAFTAELPWTGLTIELPNAERSTEAWDLTTRVGSGPPGWDAQMPYGILLAREFDLGEADLRNYRVLALKGPAGQDVILPRTLIFQCFWGPHTEMADALTSGPWEQVRERLVSTADFDNGLRTRKVPESNEWHLVLQTLIPDAYRWHVALMYFDDYGEIQARRLYSEAEAQRQTRKDRSWFCTATLPFSPEHPLRLRVQGYALAPSKRRPQGAFLVTNILSARPGQPLPELAHNRANSGDQGDDVSVVDQPKPYGGKGSRPNAGSKHRPITSLTAPPPKGAVAQYLGDSFAWEGDLRERVLEKTSSKKHMGPTVPPPKPGNGLDSTAKPVAGGQAGRGAQVSTLVRPPIEHFANLLACLADPPMASFLTRFSAVQSLSPDFQAKRDGVSVWDLTEREVQHGHASPRRRWRMMVSRAAPEESMRGRTLLVIEARWQGHVALLFEIECRRTEPGYLMAALIFTEQTVVDRQPVIETMLRGIIDANGRHLEGVARKVAADVPGVHGAAFRHRYQKVSAGEHKEKGKKRLDPNALKAFLIRNEPARRQRRIEAGSRSANP